MSLPLLETVYRIASLDLTTEQRSAQLTIALREHTTDADAKTRVKKMVSRTWINPPQPAVAMIRWAIDHPEHFPTAGSCTPAPSWPRFPRRKCPRPTRTLLRPDQTLTVPDLRRRLVARWGETSTVRGAVGKTITSLRRLGVVDGGGLQPVTRRPCLAASPLGAAWLVHAVMLCRQAGSIEVRDATGAPELFWADQTTPDPSYPHLELHTEALNRRVWVSI